MSIIALVSLACLVTRQSLNLQCNYNPLWAQGGGREECRPLIVSPFSPTMWHGMRTWIITDCRYPARRRPLDEHRKFDAFIKKTLTETEIATFSLKTYQNRPLTEILKP